MLYLLPRSLLALAVVLVGCGSTDPEPVSSGAAPGSGADTAPPTAPAAVLVTPVSSTSLSLSWQAASDNVGVSSYRVFRCTGNGCTASTAVATVSTTSHVDSGLAVATTYTYRVAALDAPTNVVASASSATAAIVSWSAATDNTAVASYRVYRCAGNGCTPTAQVATVGSTSFSDTGLSASSAYSYRVAAVDSAGNLSSPSTSAAVTTPSGAPVVGGADFSARCAAGGVVLCQGFDDATKFGAAVYPNSGLYGANDGRIYGSQDTTLKTSGAGSLKLSAVVAAPNSAGQWNQDMGANFGENTTFYVQFRYRMTPEMMRGTGDGAKVAVFHNFFNTCADLAIVTQHIYFRGFPQMYTDCGAQNLHRYSGSTLYLQQGSEPFPNGDGWNCPYGNSYSSSRCSFFRPDTWMTFYYRVDIGTWGQPNSHIQAWIAYEGEPFKQFVNAPNHRLNNVAPAFPGINRVTLMPYSTDATTAPNGSVWYDELIVSRQPIAPPSGSAGGTAP
jgi:chitodextrinase